MTITSIEYICVDCKLSRDIKDHIYCPYCGSKKTPEKKQRVLIE